jgi:hypothetical protein
MESDFYLMSYFALVTLHLFAAIMFVGTVFFEVLTFEGIRKPIGRDIMRTVEVAIGQRPASHALCNSGALSRRHRRGLAVSRVSGTSICEQLRIAALGQDHSGGQRSGAFHHCDSTDQHRENEGATFAIYPFERRLSGYPDCFPGQGDILYRLVAAKGLRALRLSREASVPFIGKSRRHAPWVNVALRVTPPQ